MRIQMSVATWVLLCTPAFAQGQGQKTQCTHLNEKIITMTGVVKKVEKARDWRSSDNTLIHRTSPACGDVLLWMNLPNCKVGSKLTGRGMLFAQWGIPVLYGNTIQDKPDVRCD